MIRQTAPTRRHVLKGLGAGLALYIPDPFSIFTSSSAAASQDGEPAKVGASHPLVRAALEAARNSELGRRRVALKAEESEAHALTREVALTPERARKARRKSLTVEAVTLPLIDKASVLALRDRLEVLKMPEGVGNRSSFFYVHSALKGATGPRSSFDFVLGLSATEKEFFVSMIQVSPETRGWVPGWMTVRHKRRPRGANRPSKSGGATGTTEGAGDAPEVSTSPPDEGSVIYHPDFNVAFVACLLRQVESFPEQLRDLWVPDLEPCIVCGAALAVAGPAGGFVMAPACALCALYVGLEISICALEAFLATV